MITKETKTDVIPDFVNGEEILIDKAEGFTSFDVVHIVRKLTKAKVGHAGTLDPKATGLLILCSGRKTKEISRLQEFEKTYTGIISLGRTTASLDSETEFNSDEDYSGVTIEDVLRVRDSFLGEIMQLPPMYSAVKHKGKSLYKYARKGIEIQREPRPVIIFRFEILKFEAPDIHFEIRCSKGTYIRVIANDFGAELGCGAYLKELRRTAIGGYSVDEAFTIDEFRKFMKNFQNAGLN